MDKFFDNINNFIAKHIKNEKIVSLCRKILNREVFMYLVFGVLTTVVSWASYALFDRIVGKFIENNDILVAKRKIFFRKRPLDPLNTRKRRNNFPRAAEKADVGSAAAEQVSCHIIGA